MATAIQCRIAYTAPAIRVATKTDVKSGRVDVAIGFADLWLLTEAELDAIIAQHESDTVH